jgi:hypothetical protein
LTGRVREAPRTTPVIFGEPLAFRNPFLRFAIYQGERERGMAFRFATTHAFRTMAIDIGGGQAEILPTAAHYLSPTGELVVSDGGLEGITFIDLNLLAVTRQHN